MSQQVPMPTGVARRRRRLSDEETEQRMLEAALAMVNEAGLTVGLDHISFEDVIRDAGVARSAVYRRWPYKDLFFSDLLKELAKGSSPVIGTGNQDALEAVKQTILDHLDWLKDPEQRRALAAEVLRKGALNEFETFYNSAEWRTYLALHTTFLSLPDGALRTEVQNTLAESERALNTRVAEAYERVTGLIGLRPRTGITFETLATLANATMRGLVVMAPANPRIATERVHADPFGAPEPADWSQPGLGLAAVVLTYLEPDPAPWDDARIAELRSLLESESWF
ncbi:TetR/AcrR family transcriptional regulator [Actinomadura barringtoniae]|uniref:TetR/AcrR family transcriptional regulator n=1 Tax=Actinomadura barringtoniae TaxID=1427535 RepID=UPI0027DE101A|nr:TetR/AcrR family transcriptional regulator [Actinomadura barringtoniae]